MKFSEKTKHVTCGVVMGAMLATAVPATASQITKSIQATYNNIKIIVDGQQVSTNKNNEPFIYNGTTYLPIRAVGEAVGKQVSWDGKTNTVYLGDSPVSSGEQYLMQVCPPYETNYGYYSANGDCKDGSGIFSMAGKTYSNGFKVGSNSTGGSEVLFNLNGKFETLDFDMGHVDGTTADKVYIKIYLDGDLAELIEMNPEDLPRHISLDLNNALQMKIVSLGEDSYMWGSQYGLANITIK